MRNKVDIVRRYNDMIFAEKKNTTRLKMKLELSELKLNQLQEEKEIIKNFK